MDARDYASHGRGSASSNDNEHSSGSKGGSKTKATGLPERILIGLCYGAIVIGFFTGVPSFSIAIDALLGNRFADWILSTDPLMLTIVKWITLVGLAFSGSILWKQKGIPGIVRFTGIAGLAAITCVLFFASDKSATLTTLGMINIIISVFAWAVVNGIQTYVLVKHKHGDVIKNDKNWNTMVTASVFAYLFEIALNVLYNPLFAPLRDMWNAGRLISSIFNGLWIQNLCIVVFQIVGMLISILVIESMVTLIFALKRIKLKG